MRNVVYGILLGTLAVAASVAGYHACRPAPGPAPLRLPFASDDELACAVDGLAAAELRERFGPPDAELEAPPEAPGGRGLSLWRYRDAYRDPRTGRPVTVMLRFDGAGRVCGATLEPEPPGRGRHVLRRAGQVRS